LEYTKFCVSSLLRHTLAPYELIFLDVSSLDGTAEYLCGVAAAAPARVEVVRTITDNGIPDACKDALSLARGEFLVLLNNDTVVTDGWLTHLVELAKLAPGIGLVGPMSNHAAPPQLVESVPYHIRSNRRVHTPGTGIITGPLLELEDVQNFAQKWREEQRGKWLEVDRLGGFCLLVKREVLNALGPLDETKTGLEVFDTDSFCQKARQAGFTLAICKDLFIHNFGSRTFTHGESPPPAGGWVA
jgi:GT2 family glycosyltransferase